RAASVPEPPTPGVARGLLGGALALATLGAAMAWLWGFTVDDALISCRVAFHLARGAGYRFNLHGPVVDAVTPLGYANLLSLFAGSGPSRALVVAKWLGAGTAAGAAFCLGRRIFQRTCAAYGVLLLLCQAATAPLAAWAVSGMETGIVTAL